MAEQWLPIPEAVWHLVEYLKRKLLAAEGAARDQGSLIAAKQVQLEDRDRVIDELRECNTELRLRCRGLRVLLRKHKR
jgi:hypothetical protein